jgi:basic amino acid/polyamine antiporter, APA family
MLVAFACITLFTILSLTFASFFRFNAENLSPFLVVPFPMVFVAIFFIAETFFGWETATFLAGETKDGEKVMPRALIAATAIIALISILFVVGSLGALPWAEYAEYGTPLANLAGLLFGAAGIPVYTILVYLSIIGSVAGWIVAAPRLVLAMAKDRLFLSHFAEIHPRFHTPGRAILLQAAITSVIVLIGAGNYDTLLLLLVPLVLVMYSAVMLCLVVLRHKSPLLHRHYRVPFGIMGL